MTLEEIDFDRLCKELDFEEVFLDTSAIRIAAEKVHGVRLDHEISIKIAEVISIIAGVPIFTATQTAFYDPSLHRWTKANYSTFKIVKNLRRKRDSSSPTSI